LWEHRTKNSRGLRAPLAQVNLALEIRVKEAAAATISPAPSHLPSLPQFPHTDPAAPACAVPSPRTTRAWLHQPGDPPARGTPVQGKTPGTQLSHGVGIASNGESRPRALTFIRASSVPRGCVVERGQTPCSRPQPPPASPSSEAHLSPTPALPGPAQGSAKQLHFLPTATRLEIQS